MLTTVLLTATSAAAETEAAANPLLSNLMLPILVVGLLAVMYFTTIRPQRKRDKDLKAQMSKMAVGDTVVTIGGLVGTIANIQDDNVTITTSVAHTMVTFKKSAINSVVPRQQ